MLEVLDLLGDGFLESAEVFESLTTSTLGAGLLVAELIELGTELCTANTSGRVLGRASTRKERTDLVELLLNGVNLLGELVELSGVSSGVGLASSELAISTASGLPAGRS